MNKNEAPNTQNSTTNPNQLPRNFKKNKMNTKNAIFVARRSFGGFKRNQFHPVMSNNRISEEEFIDILSKVERKVDSFYHVVVFYYMIFIAITYCIIFLCLSLFIFPSKDDEDKLEYQGKLKETKFFAFIGAAIAIFGIGISIWCILLWMKSYEHEITKILNSVNEECFTEGKVWRIGPYCSYLQIILLPENQLAVLREKKFEKLFDQP